MIVGLKIDLSDFDRKLFQALAPQVQIMLNRAAKPIQERIKQKFSELIYNHIVTQSLLGHVKTGSGASLQGELGLVSPISKVVGVINHWLSTLYFSPRKVVATSNDLRGGFVLGMVQADFQDVINISDAIQVTEKGWNLKWLEWLVLNGDKVIIRNYKIFVKRGAGRSGEAIMRAEGEGLWHMPTDFGPYNSDNNFVTQVIDKMDNFIESIIPEECEKAIP